MAQSLSKVIRHVPGVIPGESPLTLYLRNMHCRMGTNSFIAVV